jgi:hypothetical protein
MSQLLLNHDDIMRDDISPRELQALAEAKAAYILEKISAQANNIARANQEAKDAQNHKRPWYKSLSGPSKVDKVANALVKTNDAVSGLNDLVQESVRFTCTSIQFAQVMHKTMAYMMVNGFKDSNGNIQSLSESSQEFVELILNEAEDFVRKQRIVEARQAELQDKLRLQEEKELEYSRRIDVLEEALITTRDISDHQQKQLQSLEEAARKKELHDITLNLRMSQQTVLIESLIKQMKWTRVALLVAVIACIASGVSLAMMWHAGLAPTTL